MFPNHRKKPGIYDRDKKNIDEHYYVMDSHSRYDKGLSSSLDKAVVLQFNSVEQLVKYIKNMTFCVILYQIPTCNIT